MNPMCPHKEVTETRLKGTTHIVSCIQCGARFARTYPHLSAITIQRRKRQDILQRERVKNARNAMFSPEQGGNSNQERQQF